MGIYRETFTMAFPINVGLGRYKVNLSEYALQHSPGHSPINVGLGHYKVQFKGICPETFAEHFPINVGLGHDKVQYMARNVSPSIQDELVLV